MVLLVSFYVARKVDKAYMGSTKTTVDRYMKPSNSEKISDAQRWFNPHNFTPVSLYQIARL